MKLTTKILIGILSVLVVLNFAYVITDIRKEIQFNKELTQKELKVNDQVLLDIYKQLNEINQTIPVIQNTIDILNNTNDKQLEIEQLLANKIENLPNKLRIDRFKLEKRLQQVTIMLHNTTVQALGSGVSIKYKGKYYVLTAGHMAQVIKDNINPQDSIELWENGNKICDLEVVKHDFSDTITDENYTKTHDLLLLKSTNPNIQPRFYTELADMEPLTATEVYVVGNPMGIEDVISDGRVIIYKDNFMYYIDHTYFGNSGGGVFTYDGKLVGIVSHMYPLQPNPLIPAYMTYGAVRLNVIKAFLADVE